MKKLNYDYQGAINEGYTDQEIYDFLKTQDFGFKYDFEGAEKEGYSPQEINQFISSYKPEKSLGEKAGRLGSQFLVSLAEASSLPYEFGVALPLSSQSGQKMHYLQNVGSDIEDLLTQKEFGEWTPQDEEHLQNLYGLIENPELADPYVQTANVGIRDIAEDVTGADLRPEGVLEHAVNWMGFLKDPRKGYQMLKNVGLKPTEVMKAIIPGKKALQSLGAGYGLDLAANGGFGPVGTLAAAVLGHSLGSVPSALKYVATHPKEVVAGTVNLFTRGNSKNAWVKDIIKEANEAGIQLDAGTITNSNLIKFAQARAAQSALSGEALDNFRKDLSNQIIRQYKSVADGLGNIVFENNYQAAEAIKNTLKDEFAQLNTANLSKKSRSLEGRVSLEERPPYQQEFLDRISTQEVPSDYIGGETLRTVASDIKQPIQAEFNRRWTDFNNHIAGIANIHPELATELENFIRNNQGSLLLGESTAEARVLRAADDLLQRIRTAEGGLIQTTLDELIKTKRTLGDIANFEIGKSDFQSRYKALVGYVDDAIERTLRQQAPEALENFRHLNAEYSEFKNVFENDNVAQLFEPNNRDYFSIYNSYVTNPDKLRSLEDMFYDSARGQQMINQVKRDYANRIISRPNINQRDIRNLSQVLGPEFENDVFQYAAERQYDIDNPIPRIQRQQPLNANIPLERPQGKSFKAKEHPIQLRKQMYNYLADKSPEQVMKIMDTVEGIQKLKRVLSLTPEGKELFENLSRYKLDELIGNKMKTDMSQQVKLGTFSNLLKSQKDKALIKELVGEAAYNQIRRLQKISGVLEESASKFFNASKSGTTVADTAIMVQGIMGLMTGNPYLFMSSIGTALGMHTVSNLLSDVKFLKLLEKAALENDPKKFTKLLEQIAPSIERASKAAAQQTQNNQSP